MTTSKGSEKSPDNPYHVPDHEIEGAVDLALERPGQETGTLYALGAELYAHHLPDSRKRSLDRESAVGVEQVEHPLTLDLLLCPGEHQPPLHLVVSFEHPLRKREQLRAEPESTPRIPESVR